MTEFALVHNSVSEQSVNDPETSIPKFTPFFLLYAQFLFKKTLLCPAVLENSQMPTDWGSCKVLRDKLTHCLFSSVL